MKILIIDNSVLIIERLQELLKEVDGIAATYGTSSYKDGLLSFYNLKPDVILLNSIDKNDGLKELLEAIAEAKSPTKIIMLLNDEDYFQQQKFKAEGVHYFLDKYNDFLQIPNIINSIKTHYSNVI
jgi:DNA-binding NarL/FixJ family response regulator